MTKLGLGITVICTAYSGFICGVCMESVRQNKRLEVEHKLTKENERELNVTIVELEEQNVALRKELAKAEKQIELEKQEKIDDLTKLQEKIEKLETQLEKFTENKNETETT